MNKQMPYIIDIEASGFGPDSYPIEVGVVMDGESRFCSLIKPAPDWDFWSKEAEHQHKISRQSLNAYGADPRVVATQLNEFLRNKTVYSDGWVVDSPWLITLFDTAKISMQFRISPLEMILSEGQMKVWHQVKETVQKKLSLDRHRATNDALVIQQTYILTKELAESVE